MRDLRLVLRTDATFTVGETDRQHERLDRQFPDDFVVQLGRHSVHIPANGPPGLTDAAHNCNVELLPLRVAHTQYRLVLLAAGEPGVSECGFGQYRRNPLPHLRPCLPVAPQAHLHTQRCVDIVLLGDLGLAENLRLQKTVFLVVRQRVDEHLGRVGLSVHIVHDLEVHQPPVDLFGRHVVRLQLLGKLGGRHLRRNAHVVQFVLLPLAHNLVLLNVPSAEC